jgi:hypothetical protein
MTRTDDYIVLSRITADRVALVLQMTSGGIRSSQQRGRERELTCKA